jgi:hypothetical protein
MALLIQVNTRLFTYPYRVHQNLRQSEHLSLSLVNNINHQISITLVGVIHTKISRENLVLTYTVTVLSHVRFEVQLGCFFLNRTRISYKTKNINLHSMLIDS